MNLTPSSPHLARRFAAMLYDLLVLAALWMLAGALSIAATGGAMDVSDPPWWQRVLLLAVTAIYFVLSWTRGGQTIGMRAWRLRVVDADGDPLRAGVALTRFFLASLSLLLLGTGFWSALLDRQHRTAHDRFCETMMTRAQATSVQRSSEAKKTRNSQSS